MCSSSERVGLNDFLGVSMHRPAANSMVLALQTQCHAEMSPDECASTSLFASTLSCSNGIISGKSERTTLAPPKAAACACLTQKYLQENVSCSLWLMAQRRDCSLLTCPTKPRPLPSSSTERPRVSCLVPLINSACSCADVQTPFPMWFPNLLSGSEITRNL